MAERLIEDKLEQLPDNARKEVLDHIDFLLQKYGKGKKVEKFKFDWEGGISELKKKYTSVELQHKALDWR